MAKQIKIEPVKTEVLVEDKPVNVVSPWKWRYYCDSCTGVAKYAMEPLEFQVVRCQSCGKVIGYKKENWIKM